MATSFGGIWGRQVRPYGAEIDEGPVLPKGDGAAWQFKERTTRNSGPAGDWKVMPLFDFFGQ